MNKIDLTNQKKGKLLIKSIVPKELRPNQNHGNYWYCDCDCGTKDVKVPTSYLTDNGNYHQTSCGCDRKIKAFLASTRNDIDEDYVNSFDDFDKLLRVHSLISRSSGIPIKQYSLKDYKEITDYLYYNKNFNAVYNFWKKQERLNTFYDWAKPSLDHIIPKSRGGGNNIENLQVLTTFENLAKRDMTQKEWEDFKIKTNTTSSYFIESILSERGDAEYEV